MAHKYAACGRLRLLSPVCERHARQAPARAEKWVSKRGTLRFIQENDTGRARTPHFLPSARRPTRLPLQIINPPSPRGELARFSREFPHNCFRVAPMGEVAVSDMALVSGLVSAGP